MANGIDRLRSGGDEDETGQLISQGIGMAVGTILGLVFRHIQKGKEKDFLSQIEKAHTPEQKMAAYKAGHDAGILDVKEASMGIMKSMEEMNVRLSTNTISELVKTGSIDQLSPEARKEIVANEERIGNAMTIASKVNNMRESAFNFEVKKLELKQAKTKLEEQKAEREIKVLRNELEQKYIEEGVPFSKTAAGDPVPDIRKAEKETEKEGSLLKRRTELAKLKPEELVTLGESLEIPATEKEEPGFLRKTLGLAGKEVEKSPGKLLNEILTAEGSSTQEKSGVASIMASIALRNNFRNYIVNKVEDEFGPLDAREKKRLELDLLKSLEKGKGINEQSEFAFDKGFDYYKSLSPSKQQLVKSKLFSEIPSDSPWGIRMKSFFDKEAPQQPPTPQVPQQQPPQAPEQQQPQPIMPQLPSSQGAPGPMPSLNPEVREIQKIGGIAPGAEGIMLPPSGTPGVVKSSFGADVLDMLQKQGLNPEQVEGAIMDNPNINKDIDLKDIHVSQVPALLKFLGF